MNELRKSSFFIMDSYKEIGKQPPLGQLNTGLLFLDFERLISEPEYAAIERMTFGHGVVQKRYQYSQDLVRALTEAKLTSKLRSLIEKPVSIEEKTFEPEELIIYYDGVFLDYIHQLKDKIFRLVWWMVQDEKTKFRLQEPNSISFKNLSRHESIIKKIGVYDLLQEWDQSSSTGVAVALRKRTQHHHFVSNLQLNSDFQKLKMAKSMLSPTSINMLSEYDKTRMKQIEEESYKKWKEDIESKHSKTIEAVETNLNKIASKLIEFYKVPIDPKKYAEIANKYTENQKRFDVKNQARIDKIDPTLKELIDGMIKINQEEFGDKLHSIYLVGSCGRGEFTPGSSDINLYIILENESYEAITKEISPLINAAFLTKKAFLSNEHTKDRFICWSDGVLLAGKEIEFDEKEFPKPGTFLALLLNKGFIEKLEKIKEDVAKLEKPDKKLLRLYSLKAMKIMLDFSFAVAMSNKPFYTGSRKEKIDYIKETLPAGRKQTTTFEAIYHKGVIYQKDFPMLIDTYLKNGRRNYQKLIDVEAEIIDEEKDKNS